MRGIGVGSRQDFEAMNRAVVANNVRPVIDRIFAFEARPIATWKRRATSARCSSASGEGHAIR
jgi:hypothetical protein